MIEDNYDDIINLPHHVSTKRPRMSMEKRAAQFAPFAALTGYKEVIENTNKEINKDKVAENPEDIDWGA